MRQFNDLTPDEQQVAEDKALAELMGAVIEGQFRFNDDLNGDDLQARIVAALTKADDMQTPWFAHEYLMDDTVVADALRGMARADAEDALYPADSEHVIRL